jgi:hypothetical protein
MPLAHSKNFRSRSRRHSTGVRIVDHRRVDDHTRAARGREDDRLAVLDAVLREPASALTSARRSEEVIRDMFRQLPGGRAHEWELKGGRFLGHRCASVTADSPRVKTGVSRYYVEHGRQAVAHSADVCPKAPGVHRRSRLHRSQTRSWRRAVSRTAAERCAGRGGVRRVPRVRRLDSPSAAGVP